jgi:enolase
MTSISVVQAREILDSRGIPTIEVDVRLDDGRIGRSAAPGGGSRGRWEAVELRDGQHSRYAGLGVRAAVARVNDVIAPSIVGMELGQSSWLEQCRRLDHSLIALDGTPDRSRLGANTMAALSLATLRALGDGEQLYQGLSQERRCYLPVPMFNVLNGGRHADNDIDFQEFMLAPVGAPSFSEALRMGVETYRALRALLKRAGRATAIGDEGGFAPDLDSHTQAPELLLAAIEHAGFKPLTDIVIAVDAAAGSLADGHSYVFRKSMRRRRTSEQMIRFYEVWLRHYPIWSIEDGLAEDDTEGWRNLTAAIGGRVQLVGDDLFVTNAGLLRSGIAAGIANAVLIKLNQVGTITETLETIAQAQRVGYAVIVSHRSGETADDFIADLAVAVGAGQIKAGAPVRGERVAKYNRLLRIEEALGPAARYAGRQFQQQGGFSQPSPANRPRPD